MKPRIASPDPHSGSLAGCRIVAVIAALQCAPLSAVEVGDAAKANTASGPQESISWVTGGIGYEAMSEMRRLSADYNVQMMFIGARGSYLAGIPFSVKQRNGELVHSGVTEGPLLYLKLPAGTYQVAAELDGVWQTRTIQAASAGRTARVRFVGRSD